jgi:hypothetical protein
MTSQRPANREGKARLKASLQRARADIASLSDWIEIEVDRQRQSGVDEATVRTLSDVRDSLVSTLAFISGVGRKEIQRSLDELHG